MCSSRGASTFYAMRIDVNNHEKTSVLFSNNISLKNVFNMFEYWAYTFDILIQYVLM